MSRLFIGTREIDFFNDISREIMKDMVGQKIFYYSIDYARTLVNDLYQEAPQKIFHHPIEINALVQWNESELNTGLAGHDAIRQLEIFLHTRDLIYKRINVSLGDFLSYGESFYEVVGIVGSDSVAGQIEYQMGTKLTARQARKDQFLTKILGPTWEGFGDPDSVQTTFHQQRGLETNPEGQTGDVRDMRKKGILDEPLDGTMEVSSKGGTKSNDSAFYDE
jgi:hypothetical protein